jgi:hypothetical protein
MVKQDCFRKGLLGGSSRIPSLRCARAASQVRKGLAQAYGSEGQAPTLTKAPKVRQVGLEGGKVALREG